MMKVLSLFLLFTSCAAFSASAGSRRSVSSRSSQTTTTSLFATVDACPPGTQNCITSTWTPPKGTRKPDIVKAVMAAINEYPQNGQAGIDGNGFTIVADTLNNKGIARVEYRNFGFFAKLFNGGKPYVDDLVVALDGNNVQVRSSSRIGKSDLGVNKKRLQYLGKSLQAKGWMVPEPKY